MALTIISISSSSRRVPDEVPRRGVPRPHQDVPAHEGVSVWTRRGHGADDQDGYTQGRLAVDQEILAI